MTYTRGLGRPAAMQRPSITLCRRAYCTGSARRAWLMASAMASDFQYPATALMPATARAITTPNGPPPISALNPHAAAATTATNETIRSAERRLLAEICSNKALQLDPDRVPRALVGF